VIFFWVPGIKKPYPSLRSGRVSKSRNDDGEISSPSNLEIKPCLRHVLIPPAFKRKAIFDKNYEKFLPLPFVGEVAPKVRVRGVLQRHFWDLTFISVRPLRAVSNFLMRHLATFFGAIHTLFLGG
jgi:hypothetical protein